MKQFILSILLLGLLNASVLHADQLKNQCNEEKDFFISEQTYNDNSLYLNFNVFPSLNKEFYEDPMWSIKVIDFRGNGREIEPEYFPIIHINPINGRKINTLDGKASLPFGIWQFYTGDYVGGDNLFENIKAYQFSNQRIDVIEIKYKFTYADGTFDPNCYLLRATRKN